MLDGYLQQVEDEWQKKRRKEIENVSRPPLTAPKRRPITGPWTPEKKPVRDDVHFTPGWENNNNPTPGLGIIDPYGSSKKAREQQERIKRIQAGEGAE
ncbi:MAG: hypothetical protein A4E35_01871 [Methanoregula sp. PtaU1.Bin051]|nr:MAG: hypothetical protein A4E35_01871 [Methanoregula sp. PtaU1.Bin051]